MAKKTTMVSLGPSEELASFDPMVDRDWNLVLIHRSNEPLVSWWGNMCSKIVTRVVERNESGKPLHWYHNKLYDFCYKQYDKYGDYYRVLDNSFGEALNDDIYEVR